MYSSNELCIRTSEGLFSPYDRVRQGCALSPLLFNIFLGDFPSILKNESQITLFTKEINHLLYTDDLVLMAECPVDLQNSLDKLHDYCSKWSISINPLNSKVMIFDKGTKTKIGNNNTVYFLPNIGGMPIEIVNEYKYLGVILTNNGDFKAAQSFLDEKARKSLF
jgi:hypothetical protein